MKPLERLSLMKNTCVFVCESEHVKKYTVPGERKGMAGLGEFINTTLNTLLVLNSLVLLILQTGKKQSTIAEDDLLINYFICTTF